MKQPPTHNPNGLPIGRDSEGNEIGYEEVLPSEHAYAWVSDSGISKEDPYFAKGCVRRMVFESDDLPENEQYKTKESRTISSSSRLEYLSAVDKAFEWNRARRGVAGATQETLKDGKLPRHFVLKMGAPNGSYGDASHIAERLKALVKQLFYVRLSQSHMILEIDIPFISLSGSSYFGKYTKQIRELMEELRMRSRLTVQLAPESAQRYLVCEPETFHHISIAHEARWQTRISDIRNIWALLQLGQKVVMPDGWSPNSVDLEKVRQIFLKSSKATEAEQRGHIDQAIGQMKGFISFVNEYESSKESISKPRPIASPVAVDRKPPSVFSAQSYHMSSETTSSGVTKYAQPHQAAIFSSESSPNTLKTITNSSAMPVFTSTLVTH